MKNIPVGFNSRFKQVEREKSAQLMIGQLNHQVEEQEEKKERKKVNRV